MEPKIGECAKHPGRSMINCPACAIEEMKSEIKLKKMVRYRITEKHQIFKEGLVITHEETIGICVNGYQRSISNKELSDWIRDEWIAKIFDKKWYDSDLHRLAESWTNSDGSLSYDEFVDKWIKENDI